MPSGLFLQRAPIILLGNSMALKKLTTIYGIVKICGW